MHTDISSNAPQLSPTSTQRATLTHLHPLFLRVVPCAPEITRAQKAVLDWIRIRLLGPGTSLLELSAKISTREVFSCQAPIPEDTQEAMDALCVEVGEEPLSAYVLEGDLHPALMMHWRVQAYLVGRLDPCLLPGLKINGRPLRAFTRSRGPPPRARRVEVEGWTPEVPQESPARESGKAAQPPAAGAGEPAPGLGGAETPLDEGQEAARGGNPPSGSLSGEMLTRGRGPLAAGPGGVHLALLYEW